MVKSLYDNEILVISEFPERISTDNASEVEKELLALCEETEHKKLILDFGTVEYISSVGLRVMLKLAKNESDFSIQNTSLEVYEIFDMVGFSSMMTITKRRRKLSLENATKIGEGFFSHVYRLDKETIVKVYIRDTSIEDIERELSLAKQAFVLGVPTAISFDVVDVEDKLGVVFELLDCGSLRDAIVDNPDEFDKYVEEYIQLLDTINSTDSGDSKLPDIKQLSFDKVEFIKDKVEPDDYEKLKALVSLVPEANTFVHGDCHIKNIMLSKDEPLIIDMDTLSKGSPMFELSFIYCTYKMFEKLYEGNVKDFLGIEKQQADTIMDRVLAYYFKEQSEAEKKESVKMVILLAHMHMLFWLLKYRPEETASFDKMYDWTKQLLSE